MRGCCGVVWRDIVARLFAALFVASIVGCAREERRAPVQTKPRPSHRTFTIADTMPRGSPNIVRDLVSGERFTLDSRRGLLVLSTLDGVIDTLSLHPLEERVHIWLGVSGDSSFVVVRPEVPVGSSAYSDVVCVAHAALHWSARIPDAPVLPASDDTTLVAASYRTSYSIVRQPLSIQGSEMYARLAAEPPVFAWTLPFDLRFDDSARVFYNASIAIDSVPIVSSSRTVTGQFPAIALRIGTLVHVDGAWYALSVPEDLDPLELAHGTVGLVLEGKGEWGDTLRESGVRR